MIVVHLRLAVVAAIITAAEYLLSTIAALSARATLHGVWLLALHRGGKAALDARARTRQAIRKDFVSFLLSISLVIASACVESELEPTWIAAPHARNTSFCVSVFGKFHSRRVENHSPPFHVSVEPWVMQIAGQLNCPYGIATVGVGSWTDIAGHKMDISGPICVNNSLNLSTGIVNARLKFYKFHPMTFDPHLQTSPSYTLFPLRIQYLGKEIKNIGTAAEGKGPCGKLGISGYFNGMTAAYETRRMHAKNMSFVVHERLCKAHGSKPVVPLTFQRVGNCIPPGENSLDVQCFLDSTTREERHSAHLSNMAALYVSEQLEKPAFACVNTTVMVKYIFVAPDIVSHFLPSAATETTTFQRYGPPQLPVLLPTAVHSISGTCERTIAPVAQAALLFSTEQEWYSLELARMDRLVRFHAYMMAVSDSLFPLPHLPSPESSLANGTCYTRPCHEVTEILWSASSIFLVVCLCLVIAVVLSGLIFRLSFRGESWLVGSARWSLNRLLGDGRGDGQTTRETLIEAVPIPPEPGYENSLKKSPLSLGRWTNRNAEPEPRDWKYEFRIRPKKRTHETTQDNPAMPPADSSTSRLEGHHGHNHHDNNGNDAMTLWP